MVLVSNEVNKLNASVRPAHVVIDRTTHKRLLMYVAKHGGRVGAHAVAAIKAYIKRAR